MLHHEIERTPVTIIHLATDSKSVMIIVGLSVDFVLVIVTGKRRFPFTFFWHHFVFTSLGVHNVKILPCKLNKHKAVPIRNKSGFVIGDSLHILKYQTLFVYGLFFPFPLEGSRFLHCFNSFAQKIEKDLTVNHFAKYHFAEYHFVKNRSAKCHLLSFRKVS